MKKPKTIPIQPEVWRAAQKSAVEGIVRACACKSRPEEDVRQIANMTIGAFTMALMQELKKESSHR